MKNITYVVGHKSPDTDSVCSAIALARLKELTGMTNVVPCSAGKLNKETEFVLNHFGVPVPEGFGGLTHPGSRPNGRRVSYCTSLQLHCEMPGRS